MTNGRSETVMETFRTHFGAIVDPRVGGRCKYELLDVLALSLCAVLAGAESFTEIEMFALERKEWLAKFLGLETGIPSHDTIARIFSILDTKQVQQSLIEWAQSISPNRFRHLCLDGKSIRGTERDFVPGKGALHQLNVFAHELGIALGQFEAKSSGAGENAAMISAIEAINVKKALITIDAAGATHAIAQKIIERKGDFLVPIKNNQRLLKQRLDELFAKTKSNDLDQYEQQESGHGRKEQRIYEGLLDVTGLDDLLEDRWVKLGSVFRVTRTREIKDKRYVVHKTMSDGNHVYHRNNDSTRTTTNQTYYISSRKMSARQASTYIRSHWAIENKLHWQLDVAFGEDDWTVRHKQAVSNLTALRKVAFNIAKIDPDKRSVRAKIKSAGWNPEYLNKLLFETPSNGLK